MFDLAAAYAFSIARFHPFSDGNKRSAFVAMDTFLRLHGKCILTTTDAIVLTFERLAAGQLSEPDLVAWIAANSVDLTT